MKHLLQQLIQGLNVIAVEAAREQDIITLVMVNAIRRQIQCRLDRLA